MTEVGMCPPIRAGASGAWTPVLGVILTRLNREPGVEGMTGRYAASAARSFWAKQTPSERTAAERRRTRYARELAGPDRSVGGIMFAIAPGSVDTGARFHA